MGWVFVEFSAVPHGAFSQRLDPGTGVMTVMLGALQITAYVDAGQVSTATATAGSVNYVVVTVAAPEPVDVTVSAQLVRPNATTVAPAFDCTKYAVSADQVVPLGTANTVAFVHANNHSAFVNQTLAVENLAAAYHVLPVDPVATRSTGAVLFGQGLVAHDRLSLATAQPAALLTIGIAVVTTTTADAWPALAEQAAAAGVPPAADHKAWWQQFWARSWIDVPAAPSVTTQYQLQRYIQAVQARAPFPIKFNGMAFTANRPPQEDFRQWGGLNWWQNLRLPYYSMLNAGDFEQLESLFAGFAGTHALAKARTKIYYPDMTDDAAYWPEYTHPLLGTTHPQSYGCSRPSSEPPYYSEDRWNHYNVQGGLDLSTLVLDHYLYSANATTLQTYLPLVASVVSYYRQRWNQTDAQGKLVFWPTQAIETWQCPGYPPPKPGADCPANDMPTIAGLRSVLPRLLALPASLTTAAQRTQWGHFLAQLPDLPLSGAPSDPATKLMPCQICPSHTRSG